MKISLTLIQRALAVAGAVVAAIIATKALKDEIVEAKAEKAIEKK